MSSLVYAVHKVREDLSQAENFGELIYINRRYVFGDEIEQTLPRTFLQRLAHAAAQFRPADDFLLIAGDHLQLMVMCSMLSGLHRQFRVLRYDRIAKGYFPVLLDARPDAVRSLASS